MCLRQYFQPGHAQPTNWRIIALVGISEDFEVSAAVRESITAARALEATSVEHSEPSTENRSR